MWVRIQKHIWLFLLLLPHFCSGQSDINGMLRQADSLLQIVNLKGADSILQKAEKMKPEDSRLKMELTYLRAFYHNNNENHPAAVTTLLGLPEKAIKQGQFDLAAKAYILLELIHEKTPSFSDAWKNLNLGYQLIKTHQLDSLYGWYYVRISSYYRLNSQVDSSIYFAQKAVPYAQKYNQQRILADAYLLLGIAYKVSKPGESIGFFQLALESYLSQKNYLAASAMYGNLSQMYLKKGNTGKALAYNDSALLLDVASSGYDILYWKYRSQIFDATRQYDSALHYYKLYSDGMIANFDKDEAVEIKKIEQKYEVANKEAIIREQQSRLRLILAFTASILLALAFIYRQNLRIIRKNRKIEEQVLELNKLVQQKQILLSELQHRVKNNLQHILSLMDIQKESIDHNNIREVILENQNRVYSMALLHDKLSLSGAGDMVNFEQYLNEMAELMKTAYKDPQKDISIEVHCTEKEFNMDVALPLGLVVVELLSNGLKHAFKQKKTGTIRLEVTRDELTGKNRLEYSDDGTGFDFKQPVKKGLGLELIDGLLTEFNATLYTKQTDGTTITIQF